MECPRLPRENGQMEEKMAGPFRGQEDKRRATENHEEAQDVGEKERLEGCGVRSQERRLLLKE